MENIRQKETRNQAQTGEVLSDGKRNWRKYKLQSLGVSEAYRLIGHEKTAKIIFECGSWLRFRVCPQGHHKRLISSTFCKKPLCVMCQWRKSLAIYHQVFTLIHEHRKKYKSDIPLLLTLTVPNVGEDQLAKCLDNLQQSFRKLTNRNPFKRAARSWFKGLEVTYNSERQDYHPHYHVLLLVPENYFRRERGLYIERDQWLTLWQESTGNYDITQVDIRRVRKRKKGEIEGVSAEVAKYATKPSSYIEKQPTGDYKANPAVIDTLDSGLRKRRMVAFGGLFTKLRKELKLKDIEQADLVNITEQGQECTCPICQSTLREELYSWNLGIRGYIG